MKDTNDKFNPSAEVALITFSHYGSLAKDISILKPD
ncbi:hypothetical protein Desmer_2157 [Desulfosporosinus meridiei DSM 13257]|uniref:Uncharacterized protein n=1 Tax=Desulfosporosinus meridiei (strain ATCC BAA-275 / DSM 13257 / KCTC 12902 / NCIMB 13706 / S10) TaxID=768704 RepID=J7IZF9_DESMD|nr:hypothetical protein Desmer_2157 [Desulfosporosinus meridiei DSM 13257]